MPTVHVIPVEDLIEHDTDGGPCICGATTEWVISPRGATGKMVVHHSLDGRELHEAGGGHGAPDRS